MVEKITEKIKDVAEDVVEDVEKVANIGKEKEVKETLKEETTKEETSEIKKESPKENTTPTEQNETTTEDEKEEKTIKIKKKVKPASKRAGMTIKAKKKTAVARAVIKKGKGIIKINNMNLNSYADGYKLAFIKEPLEIAGDVVDEFDIRITVKGSGFMSQAVAIRSVIAKAIVRAKGRKYKEMFQNYDRMLLVDDVRKVESKKPLGRKARKKWQSSKR